MSQKQMTTPEQKLEMIQTVVDGSNMAVISQLPKLSQGLALARGMKQLRELVDDEVLEDVMSLQGTSLGFKTDKDEHGGYQKSIVKDAVIDCWLRGGSVVGNEMNIISGKCYLTKEYYERQVRELVHDLRVTEHVPVTSNGGALVPMEASWVYDGRQEELKCLKTDDGDARIAVRVNKGMGVDAILGKAYRKLYARIYRRVTGSDWLETEAATTEHVEPPPTPRIEKSTPDSQPSDPFDGLSEALQKCDLIREVNELAAQREQQLSTEDEDGYEKLSEMCERRRYEIKSGRGERTNSKVAT